MIPIWYTCNQLPPSLTKKGKSTNNSTFNSSDADDESKGSLKNYVTQLWQVGKWNFVTQCYDKIPWQVGQKSLCYVTKSKKILTHISAHVRHQRCFQMQQASDCSFIEFTSSSDNMVYCKIIFLLLLSVMCLFDYSLAAPVNLKECVKTAFVTV